MIAGDTAWVLVSAGLVMVMLPGLALFYGGQVSGRNVLVMLQQNIFPVQIVLSEASLYTKAPHTEMFRGQRRVVEFEPRLRLEVTAAESDVPRVLQALQRIADAGTYLQVIDARLPEAVGGSETPRT